MRITVPRPYEIKVVCCRALSWLLAYWSDNFEYLAYGCPFFNALVEEKRNWPLMQMYTSPLTSHQFQVNYIPFDSCSLSYYNVTMIYPLRELFKELSNKVHSPLITLLPLAHIMEKVEGYGPHPERATHSCTIVNQHTMKQWLYLLSKLQGRKKD